MLTNEVNHILNRMVFIRKSFELNSMSNTLLLLVITTEFDSELSNLLFSICSSEDITKLQRMAVDMFASEISRSMSEVDAIVEKSLNEDIPNEIQTNEDGNTLITPLMADDNLATTLMSAGEAKNVLSERFGLKSEDLMIDSLMVFYGLVDISNEQNLRIRRSIENIIHVNDAIIGEALISKFDPTFKSVLLEKKRGQKLGLAENDKDKDNGVKVFHANNTEELQDIISKIQNGVDDDDDEDIDAGVSNGNMVKVCNLIDQYEVRELVARDKYVEQVATLMSQCGNRVIALVGEKGSGLSYFKYLINEYINQRYPNRFQNLHFHKLFAFNTEYINSELAKGNDGIISLFYTIGKFLENNDGYLFIDDFGSMFDAEKQDITESAFLNICDWTSDKTPTIITTMTPEQYSAKIEKSNRLKNMFARVNVPNMSDDDVVKCYNIVKRELDANHLCKIDKPELEHAMTLCKKYIKDMAMPKSLIKVADLAGSIAFGRIDVPESVTDIEKRYFDELSMYISQKISEEEEKGVKGSALDHIYAEAEKTRGKDKYKLRKQVRKFRTEVRKQNLKVTTSDIEQAITMITGVLSEQMNEDEIKKVALLGTHLREDVIGQDDAIDVVVRTLKRRAVGLSANKSKTIGNLIFCGESGVGKTELAKKLAKYMFGDEKNMVRIDMSEFSERHTMSKLIGTSAGFVGYENDGVLTKAVREKKYCVVLLDEMEKAAPEVFNLFLQVFDDGRLTTGQGELVDFSNTIIIMTSNVGARKTQELGDGIGFSKSATYKQDIFEKELRKTFQPEFLNRIDNIIVFNHLEKDSIEKITKLQLDRLVKTVAESGRQLQYTDEVVSFISNEADKETNMGARPINRAIQNLIEVPLADLIVDNYERNITGIKVDVADNKISLSEYLYEKTTTEKKKRGGRKKKVVAEEQKD